MTFSTTGAFVRRSAGTLGALLLASSTVLAADLPSRRAPPVYAPPPPIPVSTWTGLYVGVAGGVDFLRNNWNTQQLATGFVTDGVSNHAGFGETRGRIGGLVGYNYQITSIVVGVEGDGFYDFGRTKSSFGAPGTVAYVTPFSGGADSDSAFASSKYDASVRGRLGYLFTPTLLVYATGGAAFRDGTYGLNCTGNGFSSWCSQPEFAKYKTNLVGYTVGGGLEYKLTNNISVRADYRYSDFGHKHLDFFGPPNSVAGDYFGVDTHQNASTVTVGLAYRFDALVPAPVVARY